MMGAAATRAETSAANTRHRSVRDGRSGTFSVVNAEPRAAEPAAEMRRDLRFGRWTGLALPFAALVTAWTLAGFARIVQDHLTVQYDLWFEIGMVFGQVAFQWVVLWRGTWTDRLDYAVILVFVSSLGAALLWPLLVLNTIDPVRPLVAILYFFAVVAVMFAVHLINVARAGLPWVLCATWVVYRLLILAVVLPIY